MCAGRRKAKAKMGMEKTNFMVIFPVMQVVFSLPGIIGAVVAMRQSPFVQVPCLASPGSVPLSMEAQTHDMCFVTRAGLRALRP